MTSPTLAYESGVDALASDERVLWEGQPKAHPNPLFERRIRIKPGRIKIALALILIPLATGMIAWAGGRGNVWFVALATLFLLILTATAVFISLRDDPPKPADLSHIRYRITNRRIMRTKPRPGRSHKQVEIAEMQSLIVVHGPRPAITIDGVELDEFQPRVEFANADEIDVIQRLIVDLLARSGRRAKLRRTPVTQTGDIQAGTAIGAQATSSAAPPELPAGVVLGPSERVLWSGRPRWKEGLTREWLWARIKLAAWLMAPTVLLLSCLGQLPEALPRMHWIVGAIALMWLSVGMFQLLIDPIREPRRRRRTRYVLTNVRGIIVELAEKPGGKSTVRSVFLDMASSVEMTTRTDGTANLWFGGMRVERVVDGPALHVIATEAIRNAGTAAGVMTPPAAGIMPPG